MTTEEGNKLIAEFMGGKYEKEVPFLVGPNDIWLPFHGIYTKKRLKYHSSWDWLMPVVDKCTDLKEYSEYKQLAQFGEGGISINTKFIKSTWESVVEFIVWYNQNKEK